LYGLTLGLPHLGELHAGVGDHGRRPVGQMVV